MKKILCFFLIIFCLCNMCACSSDTANDNNHDYSRDTTITESEAEGKATVALYNQLKAYSYYNESFDVSQTKYTVASINGSGSLGYTVNGTYSLYDKYGNFKRREKFSVEVNSNGYAQVIEW